MQSTSIGKEKTLLATGEERKAGEPMRITRGVGCHRYMLEM